ncbi:isoprenyl transferase [Flavobacteriaceae bacterium]|nr:isoprenyl transferase [Flavobacteriaceae bacterium]
MDKHIPKHIAIIMDGNGRWAKMKGKVRISGHTEGTETVREIVEEASQLEITHLTLFTFSSENWLRPKTEVSVLMKLLVSSLRKEFKNLTKNNICLKAVGKIDTLPKGVQKELNHVIDQTKENDGMVLTLALSYGGQEELVSATREIAHKVKNSLISPEKVDQSTIIEHLYSRDLPNVDLLIRTSGEMRISNFLPWQIAYAELYFTEVLWPDFRKKDLHDAISNYRKRERRFGKTSEQLKE